MFGKDRPSDRRIGEGETLLAAGDHRFTPKGEAHPAGLRGDRRIHRRRKANQKLWWIAFVQLNGETHWHIANEQPAGSWVKLNRLCQQLAEHLGNGTQWDVAAAVLQHEVRG